MFSVPTRIRYALRALIRLRSHNPASGPMALHQIARDENISIKYLESIFTQLRRAGIVQSVRGADGGYHLAQPASEISILRILEAVEGPLVTVDCLQHPERCPQKNICQTYSLWDELQIHLETFFNGKTLETLSTCQVGEISTKGRRQ